MLHHHPPPPSKYHPNSLSQFLAMHHHHQQHQHRVASPPSTILDDMESTGATQVNSAFGGNIGKSFTIAAILGLKKNAAAAAAAVAMEHHHSQHHQHLHPHHNSHPNPHHHQPHQPHPFHLHNLATNHSGREYSSVMNLSINNANGNPATNNPSLNNNNINHSNNNINRMPAALEKHLSIQQHQQQNHHLHNATSALQSLQQLQQVHGGGSGFAGRERSKNDHMTSKKNSLKSKRVRTIFTPEQLERLESEFERQQYMVGPERLYLAHTLQLTEAQVKVWFQNRRIKWRKHHLELTQQKLAMIRQHQGPPTAAALPDPSHSPSSPALPAPPPECDVSVCTDSMDSRGSVHDDDGDNED